MNHHDLARAFSGHRFEEVFASLDPDVIWRLVGSTDLHGRDAVMAACQGTTAENAKVTTTWVRFVSTGDGAVVAVDAVGRYQGPDGVTAVSSCDIYEFVEDRIGVITSYAVEVDPDQASPGSGG